MKANDFMIASLKHKITTLEKRNKELEDLLEEASNKTIAIQAEVAMLKNFIRRASNVEPPAENRESIK